MCRNSLNPDPKRAAPQSMPKSPEDFEALEHALRLDLVELPSTFAEARNIRGRVGRVVYVFSMLGIQGSGYSDARMGF